MRGRAPVLLVLVLILAACDPLALPEASPTPELTATPSAVPATDTPEPTETPEIEETPTRSQALATFTPSVSPGSGQSDIERELVQIESDTVRVRGLEPK